MRRCHMRVMASRCFGALIVVPMLLCGPASAAPPEADVSSRGPARCGSMYAPPKARAGDAVKPRTCPAPASRQYTPKFQTIGHQVLADESHACFVPDLAFERLDALIEQGMQRYKAAQGESDKPSAHRFFQAMGEALRQAGFQLFIPTETLGDALVIRQLDNGGRHIMDCDTGSLLYLSAAEALGLPVSMVEIKLDSATGHHYLRGSAMDEAPIDWDTNGREQCATPTGLPAWQGRTMARGEVLGYARGLRGLQYQKTGRNVEALNDYRSATAMYPKSPWAHNNLAWLLATRAEFDKPADAREAIDSALAAISIERAANHLDTLACAYARQGDCASAIAAGQEAVSLEPGNETFKRRLREFQATPPSHCVGQD